ncbi:hypothetical protein PRZ48_012489 [Zasmidium cellare]|uniref:Heterokaryon incompatibility domain-containing protein n=1 Tax=Zasmidium cellare TaxID=395010 RepID=A0ABR0E508_ZASCE|nr:hypothetical protein PRZ48_012489 [Zasmidium cellare]
MAATYQPLDPAKREIRLLIVDTSRLDEQDGVVCHLETVSLLEDPCPSYEAISWCWGDQSRRGQIIVNDQIVDVSANAAEVLRRVAFDKNHPRVWIDAVCINQADIVERGQQVSMMREVYSKAERVLAWLGEDEGTTEAAMKSIERLLEQCRLETGGVEDLRDVFFDGVYRKYSDLPLPEDTDWAAISTFYNAPWFFRVWIIQEVLLARSALCFRGPHVLPWPSISLAAQWLNHRNYHRFIGASNPGIGIDKASRLWRFTHVKPHLTNLLTMNVYLQATEPLDKVFGILGLVGSLGIEGVGIVPDYEAGVGEVFARATRAAVEANGLALLDCAQQLVPYEGQEDKTDAVDVPSWVPRYDWRDYRPGGSPAIPELPLRFGACGGRPLELQPSSDPKTLRLKGHLLDRITTTSALLSSSLILNADVLSKEILSLLSLTRSLGLDDWDLAYTLTSNLTHAQNPADQSPEYLYQYRQFILECRAKPHNPDSSSLTYFTTTAWSFANTLYTHGRNRRFFSTSSGIIGTGYPGVQVGDVVVMLFGGMSPFVLRERGDGKWRVVGTAFVGVVMEGEGVRGEGEWFELR